PDLKYPLKLPHDAGYLLGTSSWYKSTQCYKSDYFYLEDESQFIYWNSFPTQQNH
ncbi:hypothetical protein HMPREF1544_00981, partial [Mucor circinelloides 1006PhL]